MAPGKSLDTRIEQLGGGESLALLALGKSYWHQERAAITRKEPLTPGKSSLLQKRATGTRKELLTPG
jgi:hypothetical protein